MSTDESTADIVARLHADVVARLAHDERLRKVEQDLAALRLLPDEIRRMEGRLVAAIAENRPRPVWPAVSAIAATSRPYSTAEAA